MMRVRQLLPKLLVSSFRIALQAHPDHASRDSPGWTTDKATTSLQGAFNPAVQTKDQPQTRFTNPQARSPEIRQTLEFFLLFVWAITRATPSICLIITSPLEPDCLLTGCKQLEQS